MGEWETYLKLFLDDDFLAVDGKSEVGGGIINASRNDLDAFFSGA